MADYENKSRVSGLGRFMPRVDHRWLYGLAGVMWSGVGIFLITLAVGWWLPVPRWPLLPLVIGGIVLAVAIWRFGFSRLAGKNIARIAALPGRPCLFAFQKWSSFLIIPLMIGLGIVLRHSALPKPYLAVLYTGIGGGLFLSSLSYYPQVFKKKA